MSKIRSVYAFMAVATVALAGLGGSGAAQARSDVSWSIGVGVPGVVVTGSNGYGGYAPPAYYAPPPPVYYAPPPPVYYAPARPIYYAPPVVVRPPAYGYYGGGYRHHHRHRHHSHHGNHGHRGDGNWRR